MNNNILLSISNYVFPDTVCLECDNYNLETIFIFNKIKKIKIELCEYHLFKKIFTEHVSNNFIIKPQQEHLFSGNSVSFHNNTNINKEKFKEIVEEILQSFSISKYHFCCSGNGVMYYQ